MSQLKKKYRNSKNRSRASISYYMGLYHFRRSGWYFYIYIFVNCNCVVTRWQKYSTHLHTNNTQNDTKQKIHRTTQQFRKSAGRAPSWLVIPWNLPCNWGKVRKNFSQGRIQAVFTTLTTALKKLTEDAFVRKRRMFIIIIINCKWTYSRCQCATMQDRTIQYSTVHYNKIQHTSHRIAYNIQGKRLYAKLQQKIIINYYYYQDSETSRASINA
jgi:hypothetical protein